MRVLVPLGLLWCISLLYITSGLSGEEQKPLSMPQHQQQEVPTPDWTEANEICLICHGVILEITTGKDDILNLHRRHLESTKMAYQGLQRKCTTCHESMMPAEPEQSKPGYFVESGIFHPYTVQEPKGVWSKLIQRQNIQGNPDLLEAIHPEEPYTFKPNLKRLICVDCHGPDSKIKVLYGTSENAVGK